MTGVSECSQQRGNLKDDGYRGDSGQEITLSKISVQKKLAI
ncbi:hypothetical protein [Photorhabdus laumondii]